MEPKESFCTIRPKQGVKTANADKSTIAYVEQSKVPIIYDWMRHSLFTGIRHSDSDKWIQKM